MATNQTQKADTLNTHNTNYGRYFKIRGMKHGGLFAGVNGFGIAAEMMGWQNSFWVEKDPFCINVLNHRFPGSTGYEDIRNTDFTIWNGRIDILTGGDPCQPSSHAGLRRGKEDERYLWPEYKRAIEECNPLWVVNENVTGTITNGILDEKIDDLESMSYAWWPPLVIPASALGYPHQRERVWLIAHSQREGLQGYNPKWEDLRMYQDGAQSLDSHPNVFEGCEKFRGYSQYIRSNNGNARRLDKHRVKALGNAIVPQIAYELFKVIQAMENTPPLH